MGMHDILASSIKSIFFAIVVIILAVPILLSVPGFSGFMLNALSLIGIGE